MVLYEEQVHNKDYFNLALNDNILKHLRIYFWLVKLPLELKIKVNKI